MSTTMFLSVVMAIIMAVTNNSCTIFQEKQETVVVPEEAIVCEAEAEIDGCGTSCAYPKGWEWLDELHEKELLKGINLQRDNTVVVIVDATVIPQMGEEHPIDVFAYIEGMFEDPQGSWYIESTETDEMGQPVWNITNEKGWKAKLVFMDLDTD